MANVTNVNYANPIDAVEMNNHPGPLPFRKGEGDTFGRTVSGSPNSDPR